MKAFRIHEFGGPEVLRFEETERPVPADDEILLKVYASGINPVDAAIRGGTVESLRNFFTLPMVPGWDAAGVVEETGTAVTGLAKGDLVYGVPNFPGNGSYAEFCVAKAAQFALKPKTLSFNEAAGVPLAALTAWTAMFLHGKLQTGQRILVLGASGGVGGFAIQFAKAKGAHVTGVASAKNLDYLRELGADEVVDYTRQNIEEAVQQVDVVLEASPVRNNSMRLKAIGTIKEGGILVSVNTDYPFDDAVLQALKKSGIKGALSPNEPRREWLDEIAKLIDAGEVKVHISKVFPFDDAAEAHRQIATYHTRGKLVLEVQKEQ